MGLAAMLARPYADGLPAPDAFVYAPDPVHLSIRTAGGDEVVLVVLPRPRPPRAAQNAAHTEVVWRPAAAAGKEGKQA